MAGGKGKIQEHPNAGSKNFKECPENINRSGRPRKLISNVINDLKEKGIKPASKQDIKEIYLSLINTPLDELTELIIDEDQPILVKIVGQEILNGKGFDIIEKMLDRSIGKPDQKTEHDIKGNLGVSDPFAKIRENAGINDKAKDSD